MCFMYLGNGTALIFDFHCSKLCKHNFSYHAIIQLFPRNNQAIECPIPGCDKHISKEDLVQNHLLAKKVELAKRQETQRSKANTDVSALRHMSLLLAVMIY
jgi:SUMO ligase MMS21 Smc5/6 complex component